MRRHRTLAAGFIVCVAGMTGACGGGGGSDSGSSSAPSSAQPPPSSSATTATTTAPPATPAAVATGIAVTGGPATGGWLTRMAITFDRPLEHVRTTATSSGFVVTFTEPAQIPPRVRSRAARTAASFLMRPNWNGLGRILRVDTPYLSASITSATATVAGRTVYLDDVRTAVRTSHGCLSVTAPLPYTQLSGLFTTKGISSAFEGQFLMDVRGGGKTVTHKVHAPGGPPATFSAVITPPSLTRAVDGEVEAYDLSAKDGSRICTVTLPVRLAPAR